MNKLVDLAVTNWYDEGVQSNCIRIASVEYGVAITFEMLDDSPNLAKEIQQAAFMASLIRDLPSLMETILDTINGDN